MTYKYIVFPGEIADPQQGIDTVVDLFKGIKRNKITDFTTYKMSHSSYPRKHIDPKMTPSLQHFEQKHIEPNMDVHDTEIKAPIFKRIRDVYNPMNSLIGLPKLKEHTIDNEAYYQFNLKGKTATDIMESKLAEDAGNQTDFTNRVLNYKTSVPLTDKESLADASKHENFADYYLQHKSRDKIIDINTNFMKATQKPADEIIEHANKHEDKKIYKRPKSKKSFIPVEPIIPPINAEETKHNKQKVNTELNKIIVEDELKNIVAEKEIANEKANRKYEKNLERKSKKKTAEQVQERKEEIKMNNKDNANDYVEKQKNIFITPKPKKRNNENLQFTKPKKVKPIPPENNVESVREEVKRLEAFLDKNDSPSTAVVPYTSPSKAEQNIIPKSPIKRIKINDTEVYLTPEGAQHLLNMLKETTSQSFGKKTRVGTLVKYAAGNEELIKLVKEYMKQFSTLNQLENFVKKHTTK